MADNWHAGNAAVDGKDQRGWLIGHFLTDRNRHAPQRRRLRLWGPRYQPFMAIVITVRWPSIPQ